MNLTVKQKNLNGKGNTMKNIKLKTLLSESIRNKNLREQTDKSDPSFKWGNDLDDWKANVIDKIKNSYIPYNEKDDLIAKVKGAKNSETLEWANEELEALENRPEYQYGPGTFPGKWRDDEKSQNAKSIEDIIKRKWQEFSRDAGAMHVMISDLNDEARQRLYDKFKKEAEQELGSSAKTSSPGHNYTGKWQAILYQRDKWGEWEYADSKGGFVSYEEAKKWENSQSGDWDIAPEQGWIDPMGTWHPDDDDYDPASAYE